MLLCLCLGYQHGECWGARSGGSACLLSKAPPSCCVTSTLPILLPTGAAGGAPTCCRKAKAQEEEAKPAPAATAVTATDAKQPGLLAQDRAGRGRWHGVSASSSRNERDPIPPSRLAVLPALTELVCELMTCLELKQMIFND